MANQWYYLKAGVRTGPISTAELQQLAAAGMIQPTDTIWKEGVENGALASRFKNLFPAAPLQPEAPPPAAAAAPSPEQQAAARALLTGEKDEKPPPAEEGYQQKKMPVQPKKARVVGIKGGSIVSQDGVRVNFKKKCIKCGYEDDNRHSMHIRNGTSRADFFCPQCKKSRMVEIRGSLK